MSKNLSELSGKKGLEKNIFESLSHLHTSDGLDEETVKKFSEETLFGKANLYGSITAYDYLKPENQNKKVYVCNGSACTCANTQNEVQKKLEEHFETDEIGHVCCLGRCYENAAFQYNNTNFSGSDIHKISQIISSKSTSKSVYSASYTKKVLTTEFEGINEFKDLLIKTLNNKNETILEEIKKSNIRGRGGAGFPMGLKWEFCKNEKSDTKYIICNADEGDPGAYSDKYLLEERPFSVLFGMMIGGFCIGSNWGILYIRAEYPESVSKIEESIQALRNANLLGKNILNTNFDFDFKIIQAKGAYICGEETALINSIEGQRPEVRTRPPFPAQQGLFNKPTIVNNVETLAAVYWIVKNGGNAYAKLGTEKSTGTKLVCLDSFFNKPGVYEVEMGHSLKDVVYSLGGGFKESVKAMHIGGPLGGIVPVSKINDLSIDFETFSKEGFLLGHASIICIPEKYPMIEYLHHLMEFAAAESCGKCFPCRLGTTRGKEIFSKAIHENYKIDKELLSDLLITLQKGSLCAHGGGIPLPISNALHYFKDELSEYFN